MKTIRNLILFCIFNIVQGKIGKRLKIINGETAEPGEIPYAVSIQYVENSQHFCGGSILNNSYVITAAHCINDGNKIIEPELIQVTVGVNNHKPISTHKVVALFAHKNYDVNDAAKNDIALLKITPPFEFSDLVSPVNLPKAHLVVHPKQRAIISGWGHSDYPESILPSRLQRIEVGVVDQKICKKVYSALDAKTTNFTHIYPVQLCTREIANKATGSCTGDSGGPLTINKTILIGIVSWSFKKPFCGSPFYPEVFTRVSEFIDWINGHIV